MNGAIFVSILVGLFVVFPLLLLGSFFIVGWFVRACAERTETYTEEITKPDGTKEIEVHTRPKPFLWVFVPERTTAYLQRKSNEMKEKGKGSKATPATGSGIFDMIHAVPGKVLDKNSGLDLNGWEIRDAEKGKDGKVIEEETNRRGLFYHLYGVHWLGFFTELRLVKIREVRLSIDEDELRTYREAQQKWVANGKKGDEPRQPKYEEHVKDYNTYFPYFSREHDIAIRGAETAGAFSLDIFTKAVYEETYPIKARTVVADPNATLSTIVEQSINGEVGGHEPEYYLFEETLSKEDDDTSLKQRKDLLIETVQGDVRKQALDLIGITLKAFIVYAINMDDKMRELLELQERTEREEQAKILTARREVQVAIQAARKKAVDAAGEKRAQIQLNDAAADHVARVIAPMAESELRVRVREAEAYENNQTVTTSVRGGSTGILVGNK